MRKHLLIFALFAFSGTALTAGYGSNKPEFKISIRAHETEIRAGDPVELEITKTNISSHTLCVSRANGYIYNAWRSSKSAAVSDYRDMSQPGTYTVQVSEGTATSNTVTVTVTPR